MTNRTGKIEFLLAHLAYILFGYLVVNMDLIGSSRIYFIRLPRREYGSYWLISLIFYSVTSSWIWILLAHLAYILFGYLVVNMDLIGSSRSVTSSWIWILLAHLAYILFGYLVVNMDLIGSSRLYFIRLPRREYGSYWLISLIFYSVTSSWIWILLAHLAYILFGYLVVNMDLIGSSRLYFIRLPRCEYGSYWLISLIYSVTSSWIWILLAHLAYILYGYLVVNMDLIGSSRLYFIRLPRREYGSYWLISLIFYSVTSSWIWILLAHLAYILFGYLVVNMDLIGSSRLYFIRLPRREYGSYWLISLIFYSVTSSYWLISLIFYSVIVVNMDLIGSSRLYFIRSSSWIWILLAHLAYILFGYLVVNMDLIGSSRLYFIRLPRREYGSYWLISLIFYSVTSSWIWILLAHLAYILFGYLVVNMDLIGSSRLYFIRLPRREYGSYWLISLIFYSVTSSWIWILLAHLAYILFGYLVVNMDLIGSSRLYFIRLPRREYGSYWLISLIFYSVTSSWIWILLAHLAYILFGYLVVNIIGSYWLISLIGSSYILYGYLVVNMDLIGSSRLYFIRLPRREYGSYWLISLIFYSVTSSWIWILLAHLAYILFGYLVVNMDLIGSSRLYFIRLPRREYGSYWLISLIFYSVTSLWIWILLAHLAYILFGYLVVNMDLIGSSRLYFIRLPRREYGSYWLISLIFYSVTSSWIWILLAHLAYILFGYLVVNMDLIGSSRLYFIRLPRREYGSYWLISLIFYTVTSSWIWILLAHLAYILFGYLVVNMDLIGSSRLYFIRLPRREYGSYWLISLIFYSVTSSWIWILLAHLAYILFGYLVVNMDLIGSSRLYFIRLPRREYGSYWLISLIFYSVTSSWIWILLAHLAYILFGYLVVNMDLIGSSRLYFIRLPRREYGSYWLISLIFYSVTSSWIWILLAHLVWISYWLISLIFYSVTSSWIWILLAHLALYLVYSVTSSWIWILLAHLAYILFGYLVVNMDLIGSSRLYFIRLPRREYGSYWLISLIFYSVTSSWIWILLALIGYLVVNMDLIGSSRLYFIRLPRREYGSYWLISLIFYSVTSSWIWILLAHLAYILFGYLVVNMDLIGSSRLYFIRLPRCEYGSYWLISLIFYSVTSSWIWILLAHLAYILFGYLVVNMDLIGSSRLYFIRLPRREYGSYWLISLIFYSVTSSWIWILLAHLAYILFGYLVVNMDLIGSSRLYFIRLPRREYGSYWLISLIFYSVTSSWIWILLAHLAYILFGYLVVNMDLIGSSRLYFIRLPRREYGSYWLISLIFYSVTSSWIWILLAHLAYILFGYLVVNMDLIGSSRLYFIRLPRREYGSYWLISLIFYSVTSSWIWILLAHLAYILFGYLVVNMDLIGSSRLYFIRLPRREYGSYWLISLIFYSVTSSWIWILLAHLAYILFGYLVVNMDLIGSSRLYFIRLPRREYGSYWLISLIFYSVTSSWIWILLAHLAYILFGYLVVNMDLIGSSRLYFIRLPRREYGSYWLISLIFYSVTSSWIWILLAHLAYILFGYLVVNMDLIGSSRLYFIRLPRREYGSYWLISLIFYSVTSSWIWILLAHLAYILFGYLVVNMDLIGSSRLYFIRLPRREYGSYWLISLIFYSVTSSWIWILLAHLAIFYSVTSSWICLYLAYILFGYLVVNMDLIGSSRLYFIRLPRREYGSYWLISLIFYSVTSLWIWILLAHLA